MTTRDFLERFEDFLGRHGRQPASPWSVVERWESLVDGIAEGYSWGYYELANDLAVRDLLERSFNDPSLASFQQMAAVRERVSRADERLKTLLRPDVQIGSPTDPWWHRGVLATAGDEYVEDLRRLYNIDVSSSP